MFERKGICRKQIVGIVVAVALGVAVAAIFLVNRTEGCLVIESGETGGVLARYPLKEGGKFSVRFKHSVNQSPVEDFYRIQDGSIMVYQTVYYAFGAGVQTEIGAGETLTRGEDGAMIVSGMDRLIPSLSYNISPVYDHVLNINGEEHSLKEICKEERTISFHYEQ